MAETLYRKYRPLHFRDVVNQDHIKIILQNEIVSASFSHAYLFYGPRGIGKTTLARIFAKTLICENRKKTVSEPCGACTSCTAVREGNNLDVIEMDAATHTQVDNVRENIIDASRSLPAHSTYKIFIIDEVHMLSTSSFNALLKIVEEPPEHVIFILATTEIQKVPQTILSRCERFDFKKIPLMLMVKRLEKISNKEHRAIDTDVLTEIARTSEGAMRDAESLLGKLFAISAKRITMEEASFALPIVPIERVSSFSEAIIQRDTKRALSIVQELADEGEQLVNMVDTLLEFLRQVFLAIATEEKSEDNFIDEWVAAHRKELSPQRIKKFIEACFTAKKLIRTESIPQLPLELLVLELTYLDDEVAVSSTPNVHSAVTDTSNNSRSAIPSTSKRKDRSTDSQARAMPKINTSSERMKKNEVSLSSIIDKWHMVVERASEKNASLGVIIRLTKPLEYTKDILKLSFTYKLHFDKMRESSVRNELETLLKDIFGRKILAEPILDTNREKEKKDIGSLAEAFGGKVV